MYSVADEQKLAWYILLFQCYMKQLINDDISEK